MNKNEIKELFEEMEFLNPEALTADGFDDCIIGIVDGAIIDSPIFIYSVTKIIESLSKDMTPDEAYEYYDYNIRSAYFGKYTPLFLMDY